MAQEYAPASIAWAETQSMFLDSAQASIEWMTRYARNESGEAYPFAFFEEAVYRLQVVTQLHFMNFLRIVDLERILYSTDDLTMEKTLEIARQTYQKHYDMEVGSTSLLLLPHLYSWNSSAYYHSYGLATLAVAQWREYFYEKYGYIVDNPRVGAEMRDAWALGATKTFVEFVEIAMGKKLSADAYLKSITRSVDDTLCLGRERIARLMDVPEYAGPVKLDASIRMVSGQDLIADNTKSFEDMDEAYRAWLLSQDGR
jgi:Zn-dependent oligopeptidase